MPIIWHRDSSRTVATCMTPARPCGNLQIQAQGRGQYLFYVDHNPHSDRQLTQFACPPEVHAFARDGRHLGAMRVRHDKYGDRNACLFDGNGNPRTAYYLVRYQLHPRSVYACRPGTGFIARAKFVRR